ncbi:MAG: hypothetical protein HY252_18065 [Sphingobacteriales bacterium]|nr:hypothetical protein [Sphingobacteriales bacterium]
MPTTLCSSNRSVVRPKAATKNENCFELAATNLKTVSNPKAKAKRENVSNRKLPLKQKTALNFAAMDLKTVSSPKAKNKT